MRSVFGKSGVLLLGTVSGALLSGVAIRVIAQTPDTYMTGCLRPAGTLYRIGVGDQPDAPCRTVDRLVRFNLAQAQVGAGLIGGGATGDFELSADTSYLQKRVATPCPPGQTMWAIGEDGVPTCQADNEGPPAWELDGNAGTGPSAQFLGTTDARALVVRTNDTERVRVGADGKMGIGTTSPSAILDVGGGEATDSLARLSFEAAPEREPGVRGLLRFSQLGQEDFEFVMGPPGRLRLREYHNQRDIITFDNGGRVGIGVTDPQSSLQVDGYVQLATEPSPPPSACDQDQERGRMVVDDTAGRLYVCVDSGWEAWARASEVADLDARVAALESTLQVSNPVFRWTNQTDLEVVSSGAGSANVIVPGLAITVPVGQVWNYDVHYRGLFSYAYDERIPPNEGFHADWTAELLDNGTPVSMEAHVVNTGRYFEWVALGGNQYWRAPYSISWLARVGPGPHIFTVRFAGFSEGTMYKGHLGYQRFEAVRVH